MEKRRRTTLPEDLAKQFRRYEERKNKYTIAVEKMRENAEKEYKEKANKEVEENGSESFKDRLKTSNGEEIKVDHKEAIQRMNAEKERKKYKKIEEYIKENNIDPNTVHTETNDEKFVIRYINEFGEIIKKEFLMQELLAEENKKEEQ